MKVESKYNRNTRDYALVVQTDEPVRITLPGKEGHIEVYGDGSIFVQFDETGNCTSYKGLHEAP